jgi:hypothetical protein
LLPWLGFIQGVSENIRTMVHGGTRVPTRLSGGPPSQACPLTGIPTSPCQLCHSSL